MFVSKLLNSTKINHGTLKQIVLHNVQICRVNLPETFILTLLVDLYRRNINLQIQLQIRYHFRSKYINKYFSRFIKED